MPTRPEETPPTGAAPSLHEASVVRRLHEGVYALWESALELEREFRDDIERAAPDQRASARNLAHYLAVRRRDIRALQMELAQFGLSSLGRLESHVAAALESVLLALGRMSEVPLDPVERRVRPTRFNEGDERLARHSHALLGPRRSADRQVRIMVTLPSEAAGDYELVRDLVAAGMDVARINTAHDGPTDWQRMAGNVRAAAAEHGCSVRIATDLPGPKLRTGAVAAGPEVLRIRPERDARGVVVAPVHVRLVAGPATSPPDEPALPVDEALLASLHVGDRLRLRDAPGRRRALEIVARDENGAVARSNRSVWFESGQPLRVEREGQKVARGRVGRLAPRRATIRLEPGDLLELTADPAPGRDALRDEAGRVTQPARISCTLPVVFGDVQPGERILFDDGVLAGRVEAVDPEVLQVRVTSASPGGGKLRGDKGINLPDSTLTLPSLTDADLAALDVAVRFSDMVGLSFVRGSADLEALHAALADRGADTVGIIVKIETRRGFDDLPQILMTALRRPPVGVMVARGDLGVEVGFQRMAEVQEEILWLCEAAHVPVIWATQVLEGLAKTGLPSRGEVTDAAMSARAECVMLNKGPHVSEAVRFLVDVLARMRDHHTKKTPMLRRLKVSEGRWKDEFSPAPEG